MTTASIKPILGIAKMEHFPRATVLMAVRNGIKFLPCQIDSILAQKGVDLRLVVSVDNSTDGSLSFLTSQANRLPKGHISIIQGPDRGYARNFSNLILHAPSNAGFVAFSDQDDVWGESHLNTAIEGLSKTGDSPALFISPRWISDENLNMQYIARLPLSKLSFRNALVESVVPGNASVMNPAAFAVLQRSISRHADVSSHDWAMYQLLSGIDAVFIQGDEPSIVYRQHQGNVVGVGGHARWKILRFIRLVNGSYGNSIHNSWMFLLGNKDELSAKNRLLLEQALNLASPSVIKRVTAAQTGKFFRLRRADQLALWVAIVIGLLPKSGRKKRKQQNRED